MTNSEREARISAMMGREERLRVAEAMECAEQLREQRQAHRWRCREVLRSDAARNHLAATLRAEARAAASPESDVEARRRWA